MTDLPSAPRLFFGGLGFMFLVAGCLVHGLRAKAVQQRVVDGWASVGTAEELWKGRLPGWKLVACGTESLFDLFFGPKLNTSKTMFVSAGLSVVSLSLAWRLGLPDTDGAMSAIMVGAAALLSTVLAFSGEIDCLAERLDERFGSTPMAQFGTGSVLLAAIMTILAPLVFLVGHALAIRVADPYFVLAGAVMCDFLSIAVTRTLLSRAVEAERFSSVCWFLLADLGFMIVLLLGSFLGVDFAPLRFELIPLLAYANLTTALPSLVYLALFVWLVVPWLGLRGVVETLHNFDDVRPFEKHRGKVLVVGVGLVTLSIASDPCDVYPWEVGKGLFCGAPEDGGSPPSAE